MLCLPEDTPGSTRVGVLNWAPAGLYFALCQLSQSVCLLVLFVLSAAFDAGQPIVCI
jgi:hypothetical protein